MTSMIVLIPLCLYIPWSNHAFRGMALLPFGLLAYGIVYAFIRLAEQIRAKREAKS
jgi:hypothetical protein